MSSVTLVLHVDHGKGVLVVEFTNCEDESIVLRHIYPPTDVIIENESYERAEYYLSFPYGASVKTFMIGPRETVRHELNLASEYIYPRSGWYTAWIEYDTQTKTARYAKPLECVVRSESNRVVFQITK